MTAAPIAGANKKPMIDLNGATLIIAANPSLVCLTIFRQVRSCKWLVLDLRVAGSGHYRGCGSVLIPSPLS